jgi:hypothetical protein
MEIGKTPPKNTQNELHNVEGQREEVETPVDFYENSLERNEPKCQRESHA